MKKMLTVSLLSMLVVILPAHAEELHHPESQPAAQIATEKVDATVQGMRDMRQRIADEKDPAARVELMHQHMQMMREGMNMMGGQGGMMMGQSGGTGMTNGDSGKSKPCCMGMMGAMEKEMMMEEMIKGMMLQQDQMIK